MYAVAALRQHRWARGDWQLLPWIIVMAPGSGGDATAIAKLPAIGRWKMLDNLRRTLLAPATVLALLAGWLLPLGPALGWTGFVLATVAVPPLIPLIGDVTSRRGRVTLRSHLGWLGVGLRHAAVLTALIVTFMAHQAVLMGDAVLRTLVRLVSHRRLLQWVTAAQAGAGPNLSVAGHYRKMAGAPLIGLLAGCLAVVAQPFVWMLAAPFAVLWIASPAIAWWASRSSHVDVAPDAADLQALRQIARGTWRYFETFVTPADHMLPPDNFQEDPSPVIARRTSPTNIGLYLLCTANAHDFGWTGLTDAVDRLEATMATLARMQQFRGHFFNWYATDDLRPLEPRYVSTVDSGNLAGHLFALANACKGWQHASSSSSVLSGLADTVNLALADLAQVQAGTPAAGAALQAALQDLAVRIGGQQTGPAMPPAPASELDPYIRTATTLAHDLAAAYGNDLTADVVFWTEAIGRTADSHYRDMDHADGAMDQRLSALAQTARGIALGMEFGFLRNVERKLLSIGYLVADGTLDANCYDLLASEARLACFVAIAKGDVPARAVVPPRPRHDAGRRRRGTGVLVGLDVRIPDAIAGHAGADRKPARPDQPAGGAPPDRVRRRRAVSRGACRNRPTTSATWNIPTNTRTSACPILA